MSAINVGRSISGPDTSGPMRGYRSRFWLWAFGAALLILVLAYAPNFIDLLLIWYKNPNYSHGILVIPFAIFIFRRRLAAAKEQPTFNSSAVSYWGWVVLAVILALRVVAYERNAQWSENATIVPAVACLAWVFGGWPLLRVAWPAIAFLLFMLPLPAAVNNSIALPLQQIATIGSRFLLQLTGLWVVQQGNTIHLTTKAGDMARLEVAAACNGLSMLMTLAATVTATIILIPLPTWKRITVLASAVPIALVSNTLRIVATGWCYYLISDSNLRAWAHDVTGWLMMPMALGLVALELGILSWLVPKELDSEDEQKPIIPGLIERKRKSAREFKELDNDDEQKPIIPGLIQGKKKSAGEFDELR
jgi:exosortase